MIATVYSILKKMLCIIALLISSLLYGQQPGSGIYYDDIARFWKAYDSVTVTKDTALQRMIMQRLYLDKGSVGMQKMAGIRNWTAVKFIKSIQAHPAFWQSIRPHTLHIADSAVVVQQLINRYRKLYPAFKKPDIYFIMGFIGTGGTTTQTEVLVGTEIATADSSVNATGLHPLLQGFFKMNKGITPLIAHELTHTQQQGGDMETRRNSNLLGFCIAEGVCDFIAELLLQYPLNTPYIEYGKQHENEVWELFVKEWEGKDVSNWLYNGGDKKEGQADLGYFIGYAICKAYYQQAANKQQALIDMITLNLEDKQALSRFLVTSHYKGGQ
ncbi:DUF2268 domain-containing putative Zn-dependent protease [Filimonas lacunae]|nr:DUF2268 domain-containing putative Zn-dependent protease [Filimonas lacunae]BAV07966.1 membrane-bound lytic murein transglycosylase [Filimonas lacunae]